MDEGRERTKNEGKREEWKRGREEGTWKGGMV